MKFGVIRDVALRSQVEVDPRFRDAYCLHHQLDYAALHLGLL
jgi:hypothetical protein